MTTVRKRSTIPVPEVYAYEPTHDNVVGVPFILMEFIPGNTAMDSFGGTRYIGETPPQFKLKFHAAMADIQVQMSAIRFPKIGAMTKAPDGTYTATFPYRDELIRERTPLQVVDEVLKFKGLAKHFHFREGPFPLFHTDFCTSNMIIDPQHNVLSVIDWEDAYVAPWEMVEFTKELSIVPPAMDGPMYRENEQTRQRALERSQYIKLAREAEVARGLDNRLSMTLEDSSGQDFAHALWLYLHGRIGFYGAVLDQLMHKCLCARK
uniref:Aminoglycoside phosphotransferase domain-containing protein n=1 Tax=Bionectria ochroleuca TaxID=29856 RepID=A0A0B7K1Q4_BIOOC